MPAIQMWTKFSVPRYVKITLPHAALILLWLIYITVGAFIFLTIEFPNEMAQKKDHCQRVRGTILDFIDLLWKNRKQTTVTETKKQWQMQLNRGLLNITNVLYAAYATDYVSYSLIDLNETDGLNKLLENAWTLKSAAFFSTTTIVTIGYGNMVPATAHGRLLCILFALFGCPLAIITVGDLGKFLSELVVHCYNKGWKFKKAVIEYMAERSCFPDKTIRNWDSDVLSLHYEDLILGEGDISASIVISIFLIYNTIGALVFKITEGWTFMDSFYFCFISITTVGFGDFVPKHDPS
ncbi:Ion channel [Trichuris suis]|nr:Ion channel [Trichuris suis]